MSPHAFEWEKLIEVAEHLAGHNEESYLRTAINRAYYYIFHLARKRLVDNRFYFSEGGDSHKQVWEKFTDSPDAHCKRLAATGNLLKDKRVTADYKAYYPRIEEDTQILIHKAKEFAQQLAGLDPRLPRNPGMNT
jgi:uncharacterized protein (UPF0332 family)